MRPTTCGRSGESGSTSSEDDALEDSEETISWESGSSFSEDDASEDSGE